MAYNIIFIDDEDLIRNALIYMADWKSLDYNIPITFSNTQDAQKYIENNKVDIILTDIVLANKSGLDFAMEMSESYPHIPVILISAHRDFEFAKKALSCKAFSYLTKPISCDDLVNVLKKVKIEIENRKKYYSSVDKENTVPTSAIQKALKYINENYRENITREDVSAYLNMNSQYFSKFFKKEVGKTFIDYLSELKIKYATELLKDSSYRISEICDLCGYKNMHYFIDLFKKYTGHTPTDYRNLILKESAEKNDNEK